jgi:hypothetical protein
METTQAHIGEISGPEGPSRDPVGFSADSAHLVTDTTRHEADSAVLSSLNMLPQAETAVPFRSAFGNLFSATASEPPETAASAAELFGPRSQFESARISVEPPHRNPKNLHLDHPALDIGAILLFFLFLLHLFRHRTSIGLLFRSLLSPGQFDSLMENQSVSFRLCLSNGYGISLLSLLIIGFKWSDIWAHASTALPFPSPWIPFLLPGVIGALLAILIYKQIATGIIALLSGKYGQMDKIRQFNRFYAAVASNFLAPAALLTALAEPSAWRWLLTAQVIVLIILVLYYLTKSFSFFLSRKIPILQWILYLCAVEIWPVSFLLLFALRGFEW